MEIITLSKMKELYPNEWVLVGNPNLGNPKLVGSILSKLINGIVLYHSKDKREIAYKAKELTKEVERFTCIYTGEIPKNRRFWL